jgi:hypothetical protein
MFVKKKSDPGDSSEEGHPIQPSTYLIFSDNKTKGSQQQPIGYRSILHLYQYGCLNRVL